MVKSIEIIYKSTEDGGMTLSMSQPKGRYSRAELIKRLEEYEKEMLK